MMIASFVSTAVYFVHSLVGDAADMYYYLRGKRLGFLGAPDAFFKVRKEVTRYRCALYNSVRNFLCLPILSLPLTYLYSYQPVSLSTEVLQLVANVLISKILSMIIVPYSDVKRYRIETGAMSLVNFSKVVGLIQLPFFFFPVRETLLVCYMAGITFFLTRNNIRGNDKDEEGLSSISFKRSSYTFSKGIRA